ncbi:MAG: hypothetical protein LJE68_18945 [Rhodobacter sp.]|nr:hypothetical protein [Rhodobacter sp.]
MAGTTDKNSKKPVAETREDRLKAALKANIARRKAQAKSRAKTRTHVDTDKG